MPGPPTSRSKDPVQRHLRDNKRKWNSQYKSFSQKLKAFKDGLNGRGNAEHGIPPSSIKEPLPSEISSMLGQLASEFQSLVHDADGISREQLSYSQSRKQKAQKPTTIEAPNDEAKALSRLSSFNFDKSASSGLSRFWQYTKGLLPSDYANKQRLLLLKQAANLNKVFLDFENSILNLSIKSIPQSMAAYRKVMYNIEIFSKTINIIDLNLERQKLPKLNELPTKEVSVKPTETIEEPREEKVEAPIEDEAPASPIRDIKDLDQYVLDVQNELHAALNSNLFKSDMVGLYELIIEYQEEFDPLTKNMLVDRIRDEYMKLLNILIKETGNTNASSIKDLINSIKNKKITKKEYSDINEFVKLSHNALTRFLKKQLVKAIPFNNTAAPRLELVDIISDVKKQLNSFMDLLESNLDISVAKSFLQELNENIKRLSEPVHILNLLYEEEFLTKEMKRPRKDIPGLPQGYRDPFLDTSVRNKIRRDYRKHL